MLQSLRKIRYLLLLIFPACTGANLSGIPSASQGGFVITPGEKITIDLQDVFALNAPDYSITLRSISPDFQTATLLYDLNEIAQQQLSGGSTSFSFIMPKEVSGSKPFLLVVDLPQVNDRFIDVLFEGQSTLKPGIASTLTYNLLRNYHYNVNGTAKIAKNLTEYSGEDFTGIKTLAQARIDSLFEVTEHLSLSATPYDKLIRFFTNGLAFNIDFLTAIKSFGIDYSWRAITPEGLLASNTPECANQPSSCTFSSYYYFAESGSFSINVNNTAQPASWNPFKSENTQSQLLNGTTQPNPGIGIPALEGTKISVIAQGFDVDDDFHDKSFLDYYTPRVLPGFISSQPLYQAEHPATTTVVAKLGQPNETDILNDAIDPETGLKRDPTLGTIAFDEALDTNYYSTNNSNDSQVFGCVPYATDPTHPNTCGATARRDIYYIVTDGMVTVPFHWQFVYGDYAHQPIIVTDANGKINDTFYDGLPPPTPTPTVPPAPCVNIPGQLIPCGEQASGSLPNWYQHASHCESDANDGAQAITKKADGNWSCTFKVIDEDLDLDPNAAPDEFNYSTDSNTDAGSQILAGDLTPGSTDPLRYIWPPIAPATADAPKRVKGKVLNSCTTPDGVVHKKCGVGIFQVVIDNSVKKAAATKQDGQFSYTIKVYDRNGAGGSYVSRQLSRRIAFKPVPPRVVNYESYLPDPAVAPSSTLELDLSTTGDPDDLKSPAVVADLEDPPGVDNVPYRRWDTYVGEILGFSQGVTDPRGNFGGDVGFLGFSSSLVGETNRDRAFMQSTPSTKISAYFTQPHTATSSFTIQPDANAALGVAYAVPAATPEFRLLGNSLTQSDLSTYSKPREFDSTCNLAANNKDATGPDPWDQAANGGFVFELNAVDYDNIGLKITEASDNVYISMNWEVVGSEFQFCHYPKPNFDALTGETYLALSSIQQPPASGSSNRLIPLPNQKAAVDAETCTWSNTPPSAMQPVPVYYNTTDSNGDPVIQKLVYHRLRMKWKPKDHLNNNPPAGFLKYLITGMTLYSDGFIFRNIDAYLKDQTIPIDSSTLPSTPSKYKPPFNLYALHKDMHPCVDVDGGLRFLNRAAQGNAALGVGIKDENRTLGASFSSNSLTPSGLQGRYEAELKMLGTRGITDLEFQKFMPFLQDCTVTDVDEVPTGAAPPAQQLPGAPAIFYTRVRDDTGDQPNIPRIRLKTASFNPTLTGPPSPNMCINFLYTQLKTQGTLRPYNEVLLIDTGNTTSSTVPYTISLVDATYLPAGCTQKSSLTIYPDQKYIALASTCGLTFPSGAASNHILSPLPTTWTATTTSGTGTANIKVTTILNIADYGLPSTVPFTLEVFPSLYGADRSPLPGAAPAATPNVNIVNGLFFNVIPFDTFRIDTNSLNSTYKNPIYTGYGNWLSSDNTILPTFLAVTPTPAPSATPAYGVEYIGWDAQPLNFGLVPVSNPPAPPTPTPSSTPNCASNECFWFRPSPISPSDTLQLFVVNHNAVPGGTPMPVAVKVKVSDAPVGSPTSVETDLYDIMQFTFSPASGSAIPSSTPFYTATGRANCTATPTPHPSNGLNYPNVATLNYPALKDDFHTCTFNWAPAANGADDIKFTYQFTAQDNAGAIPSPSPSVMGAGGKHPAGGPLASTYPIPGDTVAATNGPLGKTFKITFESLETNKAPYFSSSVPAGPNPTPTRANIINKIYDSSGSAPGWSTSVFAGMGGVQPSTSCSGGPTGFVNGSGCLSIAEGDTLYDTTPIDLIEGSAKSFTIYAGDDNITTALKDLSAVAPSQVLVVDGPVGIPPGGAFNFQGKTYNVPSFVGLSVNVSQAVKGIATITFSWQPTDAEANYLSNPGGFLIPITVRDRDYDPSGGESLFPDTFITKKMSSRIWIWAKLKVVNQAPTVTYLAPGSTTEKPLNGDTLNFQTGTSATYTVRVKDFDVARWQQSLNFDGYSPFYSGFTGFSGCSFTSSSSPLASGSPCPVASGTPFPASTPKFVAKTSTTAAYVTQDFLVSGFPSNSDIGIYGAPFVTFTDPGDPSLGIAANQAPSPGPTPTSNLSIPGASDLASIQLSNLITVPFNVRVTGKPLFNVPNPSPSPAAAQVYAYTGRQFYYPLSLFISRTNELLQAFFFGIDTSVSTGLTYKTTNTVAVGKTTETTPGYNGLYLNEYSVVRWPAPTVNPSPTPSPLAIYAVVKSNCCMCTGPSTTCTACPAGTYPKAFTRFNESIANMETCRLTTANFTNNASTQNLNLMIGPNGLLPTVSNGALPTFSSTEVSRTYANAGTDPALVNKQFTEFYSRCGIACANAPVNAPSSYSSGSLNAGAGDSGSVQFIFNTVNEANFVYQTNPSISLTKKLIDYNPVSPRTLNVMAAKGESVTFTANLTSTPSFPPTPGTPAPHYRWYVNGCLKAAGMATTNVLTYSLLVNSLSSGANNDCTGEYGFGDTNASLLGKLAVRLIIVNNNETVTATSDSSTSGVSYVWNVTVLNTDPNIRLATSTSDPEYYVPAKPIVLDSNYLTYVSPVQFALPVAFPPTGATKNYLAFTDAGSSGLKVRLREFSAGGDLPTTGLSSLTLNCDASFKLQPNWIGIQPTSSNLTIGASISNPDNAAPSANLYSGPGNTCFSNASNMVPSTLNPAVSAIVGVNNTVPPGYLAFSKITQSKFSDKTLAAFFDTTTAYNSSSNNLYFLMNGMNAVWGFWGTDLIPSNPLTTNIYGAYPAEYTSNSIAVRKNIVSGANHFQFFGASQNNATGWRGFIMINTLTGGGTTPVATRINTISFADLNTPPIAVVPGTNCTQFAATPLDGVYNSANNTLYALVAGNTGVGYLVQVTNATTGGAANCTAIGKVLNPSLNAGEFNSNLAKMVFDSSKGMIYGLITGAGNTTGQFYTMDIYTQQLTVRDLPSTVYPYELVYSPGINQVYLFDNRRATSPAVINPTLYKVW